MLYLILWMLVGALFAANAHRTVHKADLPTFLALSVCWFIPLYAIYEERHKNSCKTVIDVLFGKGK